MTLTKQMVTGLVAFITTLAVVAALVLIPQPANATPGSSPADPIVVTAVTDVPAGAVEDNPSTYNTANTCDTTRSWTHTVKGNDEVSHQEYKYKKKVPGYKTETRKATKTYTPGVDKVNPTKEYEYQKVTKTYKTQHWAKYQKHVKGRIEKWYGGKWTNQFNYDFDWEKWEGSFWNTSGSFKIRDWSDTASPDVIEEGGHSAVSDTYTSGNYTYRKVAERYSYRVIDRQTKQVETGSTTDKGWFTTNPGSPWTATGNSRDKAGTGSPATNGVWSAWSPQLNLNDGWTGAEPATPGVLSGSATQGPIYWNQSRTVADPSADTYVYYNNGNWTTDVVGAPWVKYDERKVVDSAATQPVVTYYAWSDNKVCDVVTPTPEPPVVTPEPPVVTPPTPQPPKDRVKPSVDIRANCTGAVAYVANNKKSNVEVAFKYLNDGKVKSFVVDAGKKKVFTEKAAVKSKAWIKTKGDVARTVVPGPCHVPHAGYKK